MTTEEKKDQQTAQKPVESEKAKKPAPQKTENQPKTENPPKAKEEKKGNQGQEAKSEGKEGSNNKEGGQGNKRGKKGGRVNQIKKENSGDAPSGGNGQSNQSGGANKGGNGGGGGIRPRKDTWSGRDVKISRALAGILKHGMMGFLPDEQGYLFLEDIAQHSHFREVLKVNTDDLKRICSDMEDRKGHKQFELTTESKDGKELLKVRSVKDKGDEEITVKKAAEYMACIHGTYWKAWEDMKQKGISRLGRNHIHFSSGMLSKDGVVSGIRPNCEVLVYIDLKAVVREGIKFFRGDDGVLWSDGNKQGVIPPKFFLYAVHISPTTGQQIYNEDLSELRGEGEAMEKKNDRRPNSSMSRSEGRGGGRGGGRGRGRGGGRGAGRGGRGGGRGGGRNGGNGDGAGKPSDSKENESANQKGGKGDEAKEEPLVDKDGFQKPKSRNRRYRTNKNNSAAPPPNGETKEQAAKTEVQTEK